MEVTKNSGMKLHLNEIGLFKDSRTEYVGLRLLPFDSAMEEIPMVVALTFDDNG